MYICIACLNLQFSYWIILNTKPFSITHSIYWIVKLSLIFHSIYWTIESVFNFSFKLLNYWNLSNILINSLNCIQYLIQFENQNGIQFSIMNIELLRGLDFQLNSFRKVIISGLQLVRPRFHWFSLKSLLKMIINWPGPDLIDFQFDSY